MESSSSQRSIVLISSDGQEIEIVESIALHSVTLKKILDSDPTIAIISLPNITASILGLVIDYVKMKKIFVKSTVIEAGFYDHTVSTLYELSKAAAYLDMPMLYKYALKPLFEKLTPMPVGEVRRLFHIDVETMSPRTKSWFQIYVPQLFEEDEKPICCCT
ncbi:SKP1-like protein 1B [Tanacetum coccineum]